jgi:hypothetical protein
MSVSESNSSKYRVVKNRAMVISPWFIIAPADDAGMHPVYRASTHREAIALAQMFARRRALQESIKAEGLSVRQPDFTLVHP